MPANKLSQIEISLMKSVFEVYFHRVAFGHEASHHAYKGRETHQFTGFDGSLRSYHGHIVSFKSSCVVFVSQTSNLSPKTVPWFKSEVSTLWSRLWHTWISQACKSSCITRHIIEGAGLFGHDSAKLPTSVISAFRISPPSAWIWEMLPASLLM